MEGRVVGVKNDPYDPEQHAWVDVEIDGGVRRLMVTQRFRQENGLYEGEKFSWKSWSIPILNFLLLNPVQDITKDFPPKR